MKKNNNRPWTPRRPRPRRDESAPRGSDPASTPSGDRASEQQMPDDGTPGRDRLIENERRPMDPGVSDSDHA